MELKRKSWVLTENRISVGMPQAVAFPLVTKHLILVCRFGDNIKSIIMQIS